MKELDFSPALSRRLVLLVVFALAEILMIAIPEAGADNLKPGTYGQSNGWTLSLRADHAPSRSGTRYPGAAITDDP